MARSKHQTHDGKTPTGLSWSLIAGFAAWAMDLGLSYMLEKHSCYSGHHYILHVISMVCFVIALSGFGTGWMEFQRFPASASEEGGSYFDRVHFQALLGMAFSLSFAVVIVAGAVPRWILGPCE
ncbi:MAG: hypothetical protein JOY93_07865 [Acidobacteriales bacterium]|nr:hypothetical protein [Terriglobales bacterium]